MSNKVLSEMVVDITDAVSIVEEMEVDGSYIRKEADVFEVTEDEAFSANDSPGEIVGDLMEEISSEISEAGREDPELAEAEEREEKIKVMPCPGAIEPDHLPDTEEFTDWENDNDHSKFVMYVEDRLTKVPTHTGNTISGCDRAKGFLDQLLKEISKAIRTDVDGKIDEELLESIRQKAEDAVERLDHQIDKIKTKRDRIYKRKSASLDNCSECEAPLYDSECIVCGEHDSDGIKKEAGAAPFQLVITPFERAITGILVNAEVAGGKDVNEVYQHLKDKYSFSPQQELSIQQVLADMGYPMIKDRALIGEEDDPTKSNRGTEFLANYHA